MTYISTQSMALPLRLSVMQTQAAMSQAQTELSTGVKSDLGLSLGARTGLSLALKGQIDQLSSFTTSNTVATTRLGATATTLSSILSAAQKMSASLTTASNSGLSTTVQASAQSNLQSLISALNTASGGQFLFGGINTDTAPMAVYSATSSSKQAIDNAFQAQFGTSQSSAAAASISGTDMQSFLDNQFAAQFSDASWDANWSSASSQAIESDVAPSQSLTTSVSANETAFRQIAQAYTMVSEFSGENLSEGARSAVVSSAFKLINTAISNLTNIQSGVGIAQSTLEDVKTQISAQSDILTNNVGDLENVDQYALSTKVTQLQTQLETSYSLTSRLSRLSLVNYLSG